MYKRYGLIGKDISYSFSKGYFTEKFRTLGLDDDHRYENFDLDEIEDLKDILDNNSTICGFNVTIPYKEKIIPFLSSLNHKAKEIGAVNTIKFTDKGLVGYNTDIIGFKKSIESYIKPGHRKALILGTGGASKAVAFVLNEFGITTVNVSRKRTSERLSYDMLNEKIIQEHTVIVNCTPLGTHPNIESSPNIPYEFLTKNHLLYDLIYNPSKTAFLAQGEEQGATIVNGSDMLEIQAEASWEIWNR